ncbi:hypothetical protein AUP68_06024 [Ilyonectria robusta]
MTNHDARSNSCKGVGAMTWGAELGPYIPPSHATRPSLVTIPPCTTFTRSASTDVSRSQCAVTLLGIAGIASALFFQNFLPHEVVTTPLHLQYGYAHHPVYSCRDALTDSVGAGLVSIRMASRQSLRRR